MVKASIGAPTFLVESQTLSSDYDIHYAEYNERVLRTPNSGSVFVDGALSNKKGSNTIWAKKYNKDEFYGLEKPQVYQKTNYLPKIHPKRYFPVAIAEQDLAMTKARFASFDAAVKVYEPLRLAYNKAILPGPHPDLFEYFFTDPVKKVIP